MKKKIILYIIILISIYCKKNNSIRIDEFEKEIGSSIFIKNFQRVSYDSKGIIQWKVIASETYYFINEDRTVLYEIDADQYENGKIKSFIKADKGEIKKKENRIKAIGNVHVKSIDGKILEAEEIEMDTDSNTITSDKKVTIKSSGTTIRGTGLIADNSLNKFKILKPEGISSGGSNPLEK